MAISIDAKIKQDFQQKHRQILMEDALRVAFTESKSHTVEEIASIALDLLDETYEDLATVCANFEKATLEYLKNNIANLFPAGGKDCYCRKCGQSLSEPTYLTKHMLLMNDIPLMSTTCFLLCEYCTQEFVYRAEGKTAKCGMCEIRFRPRYDSRCGNNLCGQCVTVHGIIEEAETVEYHNTRTIRNGAQGILTIRQWRETLNFFNRKCAYCGNPYEAMEHYIPISRKGNTEQVNCLPSCKICNTRKGNKLPEKFERYFANENIQRIHSYLASLKRAENKHGDQLAALLGIE